MTRRPDTAPDDLVLAEQRRGVRALLRHSVLTAEGPRADSLRLVRRHQAELVRWFQQELGYRLVVDLDTARLYKVPTRRRPAGRCLRTRGGQPFDGRRYALFCLTLAALEREGPQTTLGRVAEAVKLLAGGVPGLDLDFDRHGDRRAFTQAVQAVVDHHVLRLRDGDEERFARGEQGGDALYQVHHRRLAWMVSAPRPPSSVDGPLEMVQEVYADTAEGSARRCRHRLMRILVEEPVLYVDDLEEEERSYLLRQRHRIFRQLSQMCGLDAELRQEGVVTVDVEGDCTDQTFPAQGTVPHAALLLAEEFARRWREDRSGGAMGRSEAEAHVGELARTFGRYWRADLAAEPQGHRRLTWQAVDYLCRFDLVRRVEGGYVPCAAIARFATAAPREPHLPGLEPSP